MGMGNEERGTGNREHGILKMGNLLKRESIKREMFKMGNLLKWESIKREIFKMGSC